MTAPEQPTISDRIADTIRDQCPANPATLAGCRQCTAQHAAVMAVVQPELDQHWANLACRTSERDQWREEARRMHQNCDHWRQRAEAAEAQLRDQNGHHT